MKIRTKDHYTKMLNDNKNTSFDLSLSANMIYANKHGYINLSEDCSTEQWKNIVRGLRKKHGEILTSNEVLNEMYSSK